MIDEDIFGEQIKRLRARFGDKAFDQEFCRILALEVRDITPMALVLVTTWLIGSRPPSRPPLLADFQDAIRRTMDHARNRAETAARAEEKIQCHWCNDSGVCEVEHKETGKEYFMRCRCQGDLPPNEHDWRKDFRTEIPYWRPELAKDFEALKMFGPRALRWKPRYAINGRFNAGAIREKAEEWTLKMRISEVFWKELEGARHDR